MAEHGIATAVKLASNEVPFGPLPGVADAVLAAIGETYRYADHDSDELAESFAATLGLTRDRVAVGPGSVGLLQQLTLAYAGPDDEVAYPWPSFIAYPQFSGVVAAKRVVVPLRRFSIDVDAVLQAITPHTRIIFIANPNNPISGAIRRAELERLLAEAPADCLVVVDEAYREFVTGADVPDALDYLAAHPNLVVLRTYSKAYGMAGMRVGFLIGDPVVVGAVYATMIPFAVNGPAQAAAMVAMTQGAEVRRRCSIIVGERERVAQVLRRTRLGVPASQANFWWLPSGARSGELAVALEQRGVVVRPFPTGIRVTVGLPDENAAFLAALAAVRAVTPEITDDWGLPTGDRAERTADLLDELAGRPPADGLAIEARRSAMLSAVGEVAEVAAGRSDDEPARALDHLIALIAELGDDDWASIEAADPSLLAVAGTSASGG